MAIRIMTGRTFFIKRMYNPVLACNKYHRYVAYCLVKSKVLPNVGIKCLTKDDASDSSTVP